ncbi:hypothetical protein EDB89DRAFT_1901922 [Lactarius sanguifluus]|nr:hypothetical protein EDB89DRAFT_1901922 [Lactarius sanguifluus]
MPSPSTTSLILFENRRVTRSMTKLAAQGCGLASVNLEAPPPDVRKSSPVNRPAPKLPLPYKAGFGFTLGGSARTPEERERLRKERLAFSRKGRAYRERKDLPTVKIWVASASSRDRYEREFVGRAGFYRIVPSPALLAPPATNYRDQVLSPDMFFLVPGVRELAPHEWDEWRPTRRPEHNRVVDASKLFVPLTCSSGNLSPDDLKRYFPREWYTARAAEIRKARVGKKRRVRAHAAAKDGRFRLSFTFQVAWSVLKLAAGSGLPKRRAVCALERLLIPHSVDIFGQGVIGVSACKAQGVHSGRGCIFSLAKSTPGTGQCRFNVRHILAEFRCTLWECAFVVPIHNHGRTTAKLGVFEHPQGIWLDGRRGALRPRVCVVVCRAGVRACSLCPRLITLFGGIVREQGPLAPSSGFTTGFIWMQLASSSATLSAIFASALWFYAGKIRRVSASWAKEYTLAERGFSLISRPAPESALTEGRALAPAPERSQAFRVPQSGAYIAHRSLGKWGCTLAEGLPLVAHEDGA